LLTDEFAMTLVEFLSLDGTSLSLLLKAKLIVPVVLLALFWMWETWHPFFGQHDEKLRHAGRNISLAVLNSVIMAVVFSTVTVAVAQWAARSQYGLLNIVDLGNVVTFCLALILLDGWMYLWHRANHVVPLLWRFHRTHHSDNRMDVTTATRFHIGEHVGAVVLRLGLIPLLGFEVWHIIAYDLLIIAVTQFHHADISLGRLDRWLRLVIVTPDMHKIHHSRWKPETDSNYSTVFSLWDRIARTFRMRADPKTIEFGLDEFDDPIWQSLMGMLRTPFMSPAKRDESSSESALLQLKKVESEKESQDS